MFADIAGISGEFLVALTDAIANALRSHKGLRNLILVVSVVCLAVALAIAIDPLAFRLSISFRPAAIITSIIFAYTGISSLLAYTELRLTQLANVRQQQSVSYVLGDQLRELSEERKTLEQRLADQSGSEAQRTPGEEKELFGANLELNLNQLKEYYVINKSQARSSFRMGVTAVLLGLVAILVGVGLLYAGGGQRNHIGVAIATAVAGLLGQFIGGSCFYLFNKAQDQSVHYYDRLTELQGTLLAVHLVESITNPELADVSRQQIALALIKSDTSAVSMKNKRRVSRKKTQTVTTPPSQSANGAPAKDTYPRPTV